MYSVRANITISFIVNSVQSLKELAEVNGTILWRVVWIDLRTIGRTLYYEKSNRFILFWPVRDSCSAR